jgi:hypothetical protein
VAQRPAHPPIASGNGARKRGKRASDTIAECKPARVQPSQDASGLVPARRRIGDAEPRRRPRSAEWIRFVPRLLALRARSDRKRDKPDHLASAQRSTDPKDAPRRSSRITDPEDAPRRSSRITDSVGRARRAPASSRITDPWGERAAPGAAAASLIRGGSAPRPGG